MAERSLSRSSWSYIIRPREACTVWMTYIPCIDHHRHTIITLTITTITLTIIIIPSSSSGDVANYSRLVMYNSHSDPELGATLDIALRCSAMQRNSGAKVIAALEGMYGWCVLVDSSVPDTDTAGDGVLVGDHCLYTVVWITEELVLYSIALTHFSSKSLAPHRYPSIPSTYLRLPNYLLI